MNSTNMLAANKVKLHGMTSTKWTTKDKITQYKGLINLYTRDKTIIEMDNAIARRRQARELKSLQREIEINRKKLDNAIRGDKQKLRNTLADHRELQLTFQDAAPQKVIDTVHQVNFTKRKMRDMLAYRMKLKSDLLIDLKLRCAKYEDNLKYEALQPMLRCEKQAHLITGKVHDAILKKEAAIYIRNSYKEMIAIMKKDSIYFDAILLSIKEDGLSQGKCMINATKLGQLGTEYLDDRRQEFQFLEKIVKNDMMSRKQDLALVQQNVENFTQNLKNLIRHDSDINLGKVEIEDSPSYSVFEQEVDSLQQKLKILKDAFFTPSVDQLYPFLREQLRQKERLAELVNKYEQNRNDLFKKTNSAKLLLSTLEFTMVEGTGHYTQTKIKLAEEIKEQQLEAKQYDERINFRYQILAKVRMSLKHLQYLSELVLTDTSTKPVVYPRHNSDPPLRPEEDEIDSEKIIPELTAKFTKLANNSKELIDNSNLERGYKMFEKFMRDRSKIIEVDVAASEESLIETIFTDARVPTRDDIKKQSAEIVLRNLAEMEYKPPPPPRKKYKFKK
ncbi:uncharacterized protein [Diabrotica undecimpunctata]|uniref:uncharacterized protein n=1 Tax=Diabrotica undecimpunctata TaxID=50387 RepID=UPI003B63A93B